MITVIFGILLIIILVLLIAFKPKIKGYMGEKNVSTKLNGLPSDQYIVLNNIMLNSDYGLTQIDHIVISVYGIFVIETKNYKGWITGGEYAENWIKNVYGNKYSFRNPLKQNYAHIKSIMNLINIHDPNLFISIIAFSDEASIKVNTNKNVINFCMLKKCIQSYKGVVFSQSEIIQIAELISNSNVDSKETRKEHIDQIHNNVYQRRSSLRNGICPRCGHPLVLRHGKYGEFYGCSNYPKCRFTENIHK